MATLAVPAPLLALKLGSVSESPAIGVDDLGQVLDEAAGPLGLGVQGVRGKDPYAHIGVGDPAIHEEERAGLTCDDCDAYNQAVKARHANHFEENWAGLMFASVPGGASVARMGGGRGAGMTAIEHRKEFEGGMNDFIDNRKAGLKAGTSKGSVEKEYKRQERNERLRQKHRRGDLDAKGITLEKPIRQAIGLKE